MSEIIDQIDTDIARANYRFILHIEDIFQYKYCPKLKVDIIINKKPY